MKKNIRNLLLVIAIFCSLSSKAQTIDTTTIEGLYQYIFNILDKTQIPTHYLEEYGAPVLTMEKYNGLLTDSNSVDINVWRTLYWQIASAYVGTSTNSFTAITNVNAAIKPLLCDTLPIPIPLLLAKYNSVKSDAFTSNLLQIVNKQVKDVAGRSQSPYQQNNLFAAAPVIGYTNSGTARFIFKSNLFYTNGTATVSSISIDFDDSTGYHPVTFNNEITVNYYDTGIRKLKIKLVLSDNTTSECYSNFYVAKANSHSQYRTLTYDPRNWDLIKPFPATANYSGANVYVRYSRKGTERTITKPLIVVEGYDMHQAAPDIVLNNYSYNDFVDDIDVETPPFDFNGHLDDIAGYDLIFVDYNDGTADITNNAAMLEDVITWVNNQKAANGSNEQNVVMGISMGGLVARYALADMTKRSISTGTRLLITHDSPHRGANVPLAFQYLIRMAAGVHLFNYDINKVYPEYDEAIGVLAEPATTQLLLYRATDATHSVGNTFLDGTYRNMITFGPSDPQPTYSFVATSLGSQCGNSLFPAYQQLLNSDVNAFLFYFPLLSYHFRTTVKAYALPNTGSTNMIASLLLKSNFKLFGLISIYKQIYNNSANAPGNQIPIDGAPGGKYSLPGNIPHINVSSLFGIGNLLGYVSAYSGALPKAICFVPAGSALDVSPFNTSTFSQKFVAGVNPNYPSTSKTYIAQETVTTGVYNNEHPTFTARNAEWIYDQMENISNTLNCSSDCSPDLAVSVSTNPICTSAIASIAGLPSSATVTWSATPTGIVTITPSGQQATITKTANGTVTITAVVNSCNSYSKTIQVGLPGTISGTYNSPTNSAEPLVPHAPKDLLQYNAACIAFATNMSVPQGSTVTWSGSVDPGVTWNQSGNNVFCDFTAVGQIANLSISVSNSCGNSSANYRFKCTTTAYCGVTPLTPVSSGGAILLSPNPANNMLQVSLNGTTGKAETRNIYEIDVFDKLGNRYLIHKYQQSQTSVNLDISSLKPDVYMIKVYDGHTWVAEKFIKQ